MCDTLEKVGPPPLAEADARFGLRGCSGRDNKFCALILATFAALAISPLAVSGEDAGRLAEGYTYTVANQWGAESEPWHPDGDWMLGSRANQSVASIKISSTDGGKRREMRMEFCFRMRPCCSTDS